MQSDNDRRRRENADLLRRFHKGENLVADGSASWWPPRPLIKKDPAEVARVLGGCVEQKPRPKLEVARGNP